MSGLFVTFTQGGRRIACRRSDITEVREAEPNDDDVRVVIKVEGKPVRVEDAYDAVLDRLNT